MAMPCGGILLSEMVSFHTGRALAVSNGGPVLFFDSRCIMTPLTLPLHPEPLLGLYHSERGRGVMLDSIPQVYNFIKQNTTHLRLPSKASGFVG